MSEKIKKLYQRFYNKPFPTSGSDGFIIIFDKLIELDGFFAGLISSYISNGSIKITASKWQEDYVHTIEWMLSVLDGSEMQKIDELLFLQYKDYLQLMREIAYLFYEVLQRKERGEDDKFISQK